MSFDELYREYYGAVRLFCRNRIGQNDHDADTIASDTFFILCLKWDRFTEYTKSDLVKWLFKTATFKTLEYFRHRKTIPAPFAEEVLGDETFHEEDIDRLEFRSYIQVIMRRLPPKDARLFYMYVADGMSFREMAKAMMLTEKAVRLRWYRVRDKIRTFIDEVLVYE